MFTDYFGETPRAKVLDFLGDHPTSDYNKTELSAKSGISRATVYNVLDGLLKTGLVIHTRNIGQSAMYRLNLDHRLVQAVLGSDMTLPDTQHALIH